MPEKKVEPVVLPDVHDPHVPLTNLLPNRPPDDPLVENSDLPDQQPQVNPDTGQRQPQKQPKYTPRRP